MAAVNHLILIGNFVRDPEMRYTPAGDPVCSFRLAVSERYRTREGKRGERVLFLDAEAWGGLAEVVRAYGKKGERVFVAGPLMLQEWKDKEGRRRSNYRLKVRQMQLLGRGSGRPAESPDNNGETAPPDEIERDGEDEGPF